jgi:hypothetical protein
VRRSSGICVPAHGGFERGIVREVLCEHVGVFLRLGLLD